MISTAAPLGEPPALPQTIAGFKGRTLKGEKGRVRKGRDRERRAKGIVGVGIGLPTVPYFPGSPVF